MSDDFDPYAPRGPRKKKGDVVAFSGQRSTKARETSEALADEAPSGPQTVAAGQLRSLIERIERLAEEKQTIADDIKDIYAEAKGNGFDTKAIRTIIRLRKKDQAEREEEETILDLYKAALGMA